MLAKFFGFIPEVFISEFEIFLAFALGIYALSKMIAIPRTMKFVMDKGRSHRHHRRHHRHKNERAAENANEVSELTENVAQEQAVEQAVSDGNKDTNE